jgi:hypothetical protein
MTHAASADATNGAVAAPGDAAREAEAYTLDERSLLQSKRLETLVRWALGALTAITFLSAALIAIAHISDRYNVNHVSGTWMALAQDVREGTLYRPLFEDGVFGGTWYTPLQFVLEGGGALVTGEYIVSGKLIAYATAIALLWLLYVMLRRVGCSRLASGALLATVVLTPAGLFSFTAIRGDTLPLLLQLGALFAISRGITKRSLMVAGLLCALAISAKLAAVWAPIAIVLWLFFRERKALGRFLASFVVSTIVVLGIFELWSGGRMTDVVLGVATSGNSNSESPPAAFSRLFDLLVSHAGPIWLLLPFAFLALVVAVSQRRLTLYQVAFLVELPLLVVVMADPGSDFNHLIDLTVLTALVVGELWVRAAGREREVSALGLAIVLAMIFGAANEYRQSLKGDVKDSAKMLLKGDSTQYPTHPLAGFVKENDRILSEDPAVPLLLDQRPLLVDAVSVRRVGLDHPAWLASLERRLDGRYFDKVVLIHPVEDKGWYDERNFGAGVRDAIARDYRLVAKVDRRPLTYWVYAPRSSGA